jgi:hypothetical protein
MIGVLRLMIIPIRAFLGRIVAVNHSDICFSHLE